VTQRGKWSDSLKTAQRVHGKLNIVTEKACLKSRRPGGGRREESGGEVLGRLHQFPANLGSMMIKNRGVKRTVKKERVKGCDVLLG